MDTAASGGGNLLLKQRVHDNGCASGILQPPHRIEVIGQRGCANNKRMR